MARTQLLDSDWAGRAFLAPADSLKDTANDLRRYYTSTSRKFTNTTLGGSIEINPLPQYTENCDIAHPSIYAAQDGDGVNPRNAESRFYGEVHRDNAQLIHIRAGIPKYNDLTTFFGNFYNVNAGAIVRTGREPGLLYSLGRVLGTIGTLPLQPFILIGSASKFFFGMPRSRYYYFKDTMYPYWMSVQNMMNGFMAPMGLISGFVPSTSTQFFDKIDQPGEKDMKSFKRIYGDLVNEYGAFDVFMIANRTQALANQFRDKMEAELDRLSGTDRGKNDETISEEYRKVFHEGMKQALRKLTAVKTSLYEYESAYQAFQGKTEEDWELATEKDDPSKGWFEKAGEAYAAQRRNGSQFVTFRVNWTGSQSSSFSNSAKGSSIQEQINNMSSKARELRFNIADGNLGGGVVGQSLKYAYDSAKDVLSGALASFQASGLIALAGNAFADIQRVYDSSSADFNRTSFTIQLRSYSADDMIRAQLLFLPLAAIMSLALPRATGAASYDGPFLLECFNQGRSTIREGMIESLSIEVGTGVAGWAPGMKPLAIDVNVTVVDLSQILALTINPVVGQLGSLPGSVAGVFGGEEARQMVDTGVAAISNATYSEDNPYNTWMSTMASLPLEGFVNRKKKWQLNMARMRASMAIARSPGQVGQYFSDTLPGRIDRFFMQEETNRY